MLTMVSKISLLSFCASGDSNGWREGAKSKTSETSELPLAQLSNAAIPQS